MFKRNFQLGKVVGDFGGNQIRANQLQRRGVDWGNGYNTPSDGQDTNEGQKPVRILTSGASSIVIFWSRSGSTKLLASQIADQTGADALEITLRHPYPANYQQTLHRANRERLTNRPPQLSMDLPDLSQYHTVFLGFQTWAMTLSQPMKSFLLTYGNQLTDKKIAPFLTEGGYGPGDSIDLIRQYTGSTQVSSPLVVDGNQVDADSRQVQRWLSQLR